MSSWNGGWRQRAAACGRSHALRAAIHVVSIAALAACLLAGAARGASPMQGTTSRQAREDALRSVPLAKLPIDKQAKVAKLLSDTTVFRRLPTQVIQCDPAFYTFLLEHPDVIVNIWSALGISEVRLTRTGDDTFQANDGAGTSGAVEYLYRGADMHVFYGEGLYTGAMFSKPVRGKCLLLLKSGYLRETNGRYYVTCRLDAFMHLDNVGVELLAKTFQPLIGPVADHNFRETVSFVESLNRAAEINYSGVQELAKKLDKISPETRREWSALSERVAIRAAIADAQQPSDRRPPALNTARRPPAKPPTPQNR